MTENSYEQLDSLFKDIRLRLVQVRQSDPTTAEELKGLVTQLELWFDSLVIDALRLRRLENVLQRTIKLAKRLQERLDGGYEGTRDKAVRDADQLLDEYVRPSIDKHTET